MILVLGAMKQEVAAVEQAIENGSLEGVAVATVGVGKVMAAMNTQYYVGTRKPAAVLMVGVAGGLNPELAIGDVVVAAETIQHDLDVTALGMQRGAVPFTEFRWLKASRALLQAADGLALSGARVDGSSGSRVRVHTGRILTGDQFMSRAAQQQNSYLRRELNGDAIDMESAAVAQVCICNDVPHLVLRVISDTADGNAKVDFWRFLATAGERLLEAVRYVVTGIHSQ